MLWGRAAGRARRGCLTALWLSTAASVLMPPSPAKKKVKVLCLHGYAQNGAVLRDRSGGFRRPLKKSKYDLHYADGPFEAVDFFEAAEGEGTTTRLAWWAGRSAHYDGWEETQAHLVKLWGKEGFDGVLGFSQGAAAAAMLCPAVRPKFAIFVAGFVPRDEAARGLEAVAVPSLHVFGAADDLVTPDRSRALADRFLEARTAVHAGGHCIPSGADVRRDVVDFLASLEEAPPSGGA